MLYIVVKKFEEGRTVEESGTRSAPGGLLRSIWTRNMALVKTAE